MNKKIAKVVAAAQKELKLKEDEAIQVKILQETKEKQDRLKRIQSLKDYYLKDDLIYHMVKEAVLKKENDISIFNSDYETAAAINQIPGFKAKTRTYMWDASDDCRDIEAIVVEITWDN